jgi:hypothetical protein
MVIFCKFKADAVLPGVLAIGCRVKVAKPDSAVVSMFGRAAFPSSWHGVIE